MVTDAASQAYLIVAAQPCAGQRTGGRSIGRSAAVPSEGGAAYSRGAAIIRVVTDAAASEANLVVAAQPCARQRTRCQSIRRAARPSVQKGGGLFTRCGCACSSKAIFVASAAAMGFW